MSQLKIGAYICKGCGLGDRLDCQQLANIATREGRAVVAKQHDFLCSSTGVKLIKDDIESGEVTHVAIAACSHRAKTQAFNFPEAAVARANLREGVIWARPDAQQHKETTQEMADDYVRMACNELRYMKIPGANPEAAGNENLLIVGGGYSGLTAALEASKTGYKVTLVEKQSELGGWSRQWFKRFPQHTPYETPQTTGIDDLIQQVKADNNITVHINSTVAATSGAPGRFVVEIAAPSGDPHHGEFGAILQATGFTRFDISQLPELGAGKSADVIDQIELEQLFKAANGDMIKRPSNGNAVKHVVFVQCAGQRSDKAGHLSYCSGHCCNTSIKQAMYFRDANPNIDTTILYTDLRTPGVAGENFLRNAHAKGVNFTQGVVNEVTDNNGKLQIKFNDLMLDQEVSLQADLVVLATGMVPNSGVNTELPGTIRELTPTVAPAAVEPTVSVLNLTYHQGPDVPQLADGFSDSHFICFPYETRRTGIYTAGPVRRPMDMQQAREDAMGATLKAIQALENAKLGRAVHPRSGDLSFPLLQVEGCTQCKSCTEQCPFGAIDEDEQHYPVFNESRCRRCGICMGACPVQVISFANYSVDSVSQQIKAVDIPADSAEKPRILVLACENDAYPALDMAAQNGIQYSPFARIVPVRCLGSVNTIWVTDALNNGYDAVMLMGCQQGDDYQCHFVTGSQLAQQRMSQIDDALRQLQLETERVQSFDVAITDIQRAPQLINDMQALVDKLGMSPFKF